MSLKADMIRGEGRYRDGGEACGAQRARASAHG
jgi:hypothetical protein